MKKLLPILPLLLWVVCEEEKDESTDKGWVITDENRAFADDNWDLETWVFNTLNTPLGDYYDSEKTTIFKYVIKPRPVAGFFVCVTKLH